MTELPQPPVPPECVLRGHDYFPLYFDRLRKSKWWRRASDLARARNVMMWGEAYKSQPAGSLADDDDELAEAAGYGMDVEAFIAAKAEIMAPWVLCSDGRWYHPTTCEVVLEVWEKTSAKRRDDARRKRDQRDRSRGVTPKQSDVTCDISENEHDTPSENGLSATKEEKKGKDRIPPTPQGGGGGVDLFEETFAAYPEAGRRQTPPEEARDAWDDAIAALANPEDIRQAVARIAADPPDRVPRFDRWLRKDLWRHYAPTPQAASTSWNGDVDLRAALVKAAPKGEFWVRNFIDARTRYQQVPSKALLCADAFTLSQIEQEVGHVLRAFGVELRLQEAAA